jgi:hypothetical protein
MSLEKLDIIYLFTLETIDLKENHKLFNPERTEDIEGI